MAVCQDCNREMLTAPSCIVDVMILQGERFERDRVRRSIGPAGRCGDCGVRPGGYHHPGCDLERCPRCRHQFITCGCAVADEDTESLLLVADGAVVYPPGLRGLKLSDDRYPFGTPPTGSR